MSTAPDRHLPTALDARFLRSVHLGSLLLTVLFAGLTAKYVSGSFGFGFLLAGLWSTANLWVLERLLREAVRPDHRDVLTIVAAGVVKLPLLYGLLVLLLMRGGFPAGSMVIGLSMPLIVIVLKVLGRAIHFRNTNGVVARASATITPEPRS